MPRDGSNVYSTPPGTAAVSGTSISSSAFNQLISDIAADLNTPRPISAGGTGATSPETAIEALGAAPANSRLVPWDAGDIKPTRRKTAAPGWLFCFGQAVLRASYADLDEAIYVGDTLNATAPDGYRTTSMSSPSANRSTSGQYIVVPDYRGITLAGRDNMGGTAAGRLTAATIDGTVLGNSGGNQVHVLTQAQLPAIKPAISINDPGHAHGHQKAGVSSAAGDPGENVGRIYTNGTTNPATTGITAAFAANLGAGAGHPNVQPTAIVNFVIKT